VPALSAYKSDLDYSYAPGIFPSMECLENRPEKVRRLLVHSDVHNGPQAGMERLMGLASDLGVRIEDADRALARISGKENCYAAAVFEKFQDTLYPGRPHVLLHNPGDTGNIGTILRTALGFGIEDVALVRPCADLFDPKTVRASMGSLFRLRVHVFDSFTDYRKAYATRPLYPFMLDASVPMEAALKRKLSPEFTLIFGNEGRGLPPEFAQLGTSVRIPSNDKIDSLNLAVAAAIGIYEFTRAIKY